LFEAGVVLKGDAGLFRGNQRQVIGMPANPVEASERHITVMIRIFAPFDAEQICNEWRSIRFDPSRRGEVT
jgi:hypothetical protein